MTPVMQTNFEKGTGDCFSACLASILEVDLKFVPVFCKQPNWRELTNIWLLKHNLFYIDIQLPGDLRDELVNYWGYHVIAGKGPRGMQHAVVGYQGVMAHDPHPSGDGLLPEDKDNEYEYGLLVSTMKYGHNGTYMVEDEKEET